MSNAPWALLTDKYGLTPGRGGAVFDPGTLMATSLATTAAGGATSAAGSIIGGNYAALAGRMQNQAAQYEAGQLDTNAAQSVAAGQREMLDTQQRTRLLQSKATAAAGASGVSADVGSPLATVGDIAKRGSYEALMQMFNGESTASGIRNQAQAVRYGGQLAEIEGDTKQTASYLAAGGDLLSAAGRGLSGYGRFAYPMRGGGL